MLKNQVYRMTKQRRIILEEVRRYNTHPSADEIFERVRRRMPRISLGTVYRNLEILSELGEIKQLEYGGTIKRFDGNTELHYHIRCVCCERVDDVPLSPIKDIEQELDGKMAYKIIGHNLEFTGLCAECDTHMISPGLGRSRPSVLTPNA